MDYEYQIDDQVLSVRVEPSGQGLAVSIAGRQFQVEAYLLRDGELRLTVDGRPRVAYVAADGPRRWVMLGGRTLALAVPQAERRARRGQAAGPRDETLEAQMPGVVRRVLVSAGEHVERGQALLVLEAMKMEIRVAAPHAGRVAQVAVQEGETVGRGQLLVDLVEERV